MHAARARTRMRHHLRCGALLPPCVPWALIAERPRSSSPSCQAPGVLTAARRPRWREKSLAPVSAAATPALSRRWAPACRGGAHLLRHGWNSAEEWPVVLALLPREDPWCAGSRAHGRPPATALQAMQDEVLAVQPQPACPPCPRHQATGAAHPSSHGDARRISAAATAFFLRRTAIGLACPPCWATGRSPVCWRCCHALSPSPQRRLHRMRTPTLLRQQQKTAGGRQAKGWTCGGTCISGAATPGGPSLWHALKSLAERPRWAKKEHEMY